MRARARLVGVAAVVVTGAMLAVATPASATTGGPSWDELASCSAPVAFDVTLPEDGGFVAHDPLYGYTFDGRLLTEGAWRDAGYDDAVENLEAYGLSWVQPVLAAMAADADEAGRLDWLVDGLGRTLDWRPDTGRRDDPVWAEGVNLRREQALNCAYAVTHDVRLVPVIEAVAAANMDPGRYYGPPRWPPHNHGLMANLALLRSGDLLAREDWRDVAVGRLRTAIDASFTPSGITIEQSVAYGLVVIAQWRAAATALRAVGGVDELALAAHIDQVTAHAAAAYNFLVQPDGMPVPLGDQRASRTTVVGQRTTGLVDRDAGIAAARWSWTAPDDWYAVRFGRPTAMHGHNDRMSLVWWSTGRPVLVDPATATYTAGPARTWSLSPAAHNAPLVPSGSYAPWVTVTLAAYAHRSTGDTIRLTGSLYRVRQERRIAVDPVHNSLAVVDIAAQPVNQVWQLDPRWQLRSFNRARTAARFVDRTGASLLVTTTGRISTVVRGAPGLAGGWVFFYPPSVRSAAARMVVTGGTTTRTTFVLTGSPLKPWTS